MAFCCVGEGFGGSGDGVQLVEHKMRELFEFHVRCRLMLGANEHAQSL